MHSIVGGSTWALAALWCAAVVQVHGGGAGCDASVGFDDFREEVVLNSDRVRPFGLAIDYSTNVLYFSYETNGKYSSAKLNLTSGTVNEIEELTGSCKFTVDRVTNVVYAGCLGDSDGRFAGLYQLNYNLSRFELAGEAGKPVQFVYYNDGLYYSLTNSSLYSFRSGHSASVPELQWQVDDAVIDWHSHWIFLNSTGMYRQRRGSAVVTRYEGIERPLILAIDTRGVAYVCVSGHRGLYRLLEGRAGAERVRGVTICDGLATDRDNSIVYGHLDNILRLVKCR